MCVCVFTCAALINNFNNAPKRYTWTPKRPTACQKRTTLRTWCRITSSAISYESFGFKFLFGCFEASLLPGSLAHLGAYVPFRSCSSFYVRIQQQQHGKKFLVRTCEIERERKKDREKKRRWWVHSQDSISSQHPHMPVVQVPLLGGGKDCDGST